MTNLEVLGGGCAASGSYKVDVNRGDRVGRVSSEWFSRPDDEKYLSLSELYASVKRRAERSHTRTVESAAIRVEAHRDDPEKLALVLPDAEAPIAPTHWSFGQLAALAGAPAAYLRQLPAPVAGINLQYGLTNHRAEQVKTLETEDRRTELRAVTGPDYGRIFDHELVGAVQRIAGDGVGDTRWKVPGVLDWSTVRTTHGIGAVRASRFCLISSSSALNRRPPAGTSNMPVSAPLSSKMGCTVKLWSSVRRAMSSASSSIETPALMRRTLAWLSTRRLKGMSRELESAILGTDFGMDLLRDGPAETLSRPTQPVADRPALLSLSAHRRSHASHAHSRLPQAVRSRVFDLDRYPAADHATSRSLYW